MPLLEVRDLTIEFLNGGKYTQAVSGINFQLNEGELLALVGESGCGKSISCLSLARLLPCPPGKISRGQILLKRKNNGEVIDVLQLKESELRNIRGSEISYIFQEPGMSLNPVFRIGDQIAEALKLHRPEITDRKSEVIALLEHVGISDAKNRVNRYPHELSGGMQQRVMIAMALASNPSILIADEPTTALDVTIQAQILDLIAALQKERKMSVILVTHNLGIVAQLADRVAVMYAGQIVETAPVEDLLYHPVHPYTRALIAAIPVLNAPDERLQTIRGMVPAPENFSTGCRFYERCDYASTLPDSEQCRCREQCPALSEMGNGHFCACHFYERISKDKTGS